MIRRAPSLLGSVAVLAVAALSSLAGALPASAGVDEGQPFRFHECVPFVDDPAYTVCQDNVVLSRSSNGGGGTVSVIYHLTMTMTISTQGQVVYWDTTRQHFHWVYRDGEERLYTVNDRRTFEIDGKRYCVTFQYRSANGHEQFSRPGQCQ